LHHFPLASHPAARERPTGEAPVFGESMNIEPVRIERRHRQRFALDLPVSIRRNGSAGEASGFTQNLSAGGVLFYTDFPLAQGDAIELTLVMPSEITLAEAMRVRCRATVIRVVPPAGGSACGIAALLQGYEYLPEPENLVKGSGAFVRVSPLQEPAPEEAGGNRLHTFHAGDVALP
jgi:hypothetical protein